MESVELALQRGRRRGDCERGEDDDGGVPEREEEAHRVGRLARLHQLADDIVDRGDMVGIEGMTKAEDLSQKGGAEQGRPVQNATHAQSQAAALAAMSNP